MGGHSTSDMYNILIEVIYFPSRNDHVNLNMGLIYIVILPKDGAKSQVYNSFTKAFSTVPEIISYSFVLLYSYILLTEYFLSMDCTPPAFYSYDCYIVLILLYCHFLRVI